MTNCSFYVALLLQARVNRSKGNRTEISKAELIQKSSYCRVSGRDMDLLELTSYGNVKRGQDSGGCNIQ
nr:Ubinuclein-2 like [Ipomoea batatas]